MVVCRGSSWVVDVGTHGHRDVSSPLTPGCGDNKGEERGVVLTMLLWVIDVHAGAH